MSGMGWKGTTVRNVDGRTGRISGEYVGFGHVSLRISDDAGSDAHVQLNTDGADSGSIGWLWLCEKFDGGPKWLPLGDHSGCEAEPVERVGSSLRP